MELTFTHRESARKGAWVLVFVIAMAYVVAIAHGVTTIDVARDLFWAIEIASGRAWPLVGPPIGPFEWLGAIWYYVAAVAALFSSSLTLYFALLGALAALKFVLMYRVALRWIDAQFALTLVIAATLPGVVSYQFFGVSHTQFVEVMIWATALFALRLRASPESVVDALAIGGCAALSLHAHPTALLLLPWAAVAVLSLPKQYRLRAALAALIAAGIVFLPLLIAPVLGFSATSDNVPGAAGLHGSITGVLPLLKNLFWLQPASIVATTLPPVFASAVWPALWSLLLALSAIGAGLAMFERRLRSTLWASLLTLLGVLIGTTLLRDHTPFYMLYVMLPPLAVLYALAWTALRRLRNGSVVVKGLMCVVIALHVAVCAGYVQLARQGLVDWRFPMNSNMQSTGSVTHAGSISAAPNRDAVASWLCQQSRAVALHGDLAATHDLSLGQEQFFHCRNRPALATTGGSDNAWTGLPLPAWRELSIAPRIALGTYGLMPASQVISPLRSLLVASGRAYPPRFALMIAAANHGLWQKQARTQSGALVVVSSLLPTYPLFSVRATANGVTQQALVQFANTVVLRCDVCGQSPADWNISVQGGAPETTSITVLDVAPESQRLKHLTP